MLGVGLDDQTRCTHYRSPVDIVALKAWCCGEYYACHACHAALAGHELVPWPRERRSASAVLCGACGIELTVDHYLAAADRCPHCNSAFNPGCRLHHDIYFEWNQVHTYNH